MKRIELKDLPDGTQFHLIPNKENLSYTKISRCKEFRAFSIVKKEGDDKEMKMLNRYVYVGGNL